MNCLPGSSGIVMQFRLQEVLFQSTSKEKYIKEELLGLNLILVFDRYVFQVMNTVVGRKKESMTVGNQNGLL